MDTPVVEIEEVGGVGADLERVIDAAVGTGNVEEVEVSAEAKASPLEDDFPAANGVEDMDEVTETRVKERRESSGRKKRKDRESGGDDAEHVEHKDDRKKRRDEKSRRKGRESGDGGEKRDHREGRERKDGKKKDRKERREERDERRKHERDLLEQTEGRAEMDLRTIAVVGQIEQADELQKRDDRDYDIESRYSRSRHGMKGEISVPSPIGTEGRKFGFVLGSVVKPVVLDDDEKEEGEILDDEGEPGRMVESDAESGEIAITNEIAGEGDLDVVAHSAHDLLGKVETSRWNSSPEETTKSPPGNPTVDREGKTSGEEAQEKSCKLGQAAPTHALQSMLVIAEAYDSESPVSEERNGFSSVVKPESRRHFVKKSENGSRISEMGGSEKKPSVEKRNTQETAQDKAEPKRHSVGLPEQQNSSRKDRNVEEVNRSTPEDNKTRSSHRNETRAESISEREEFREQSIADKSKTKVIRHSDTLEQEDPSLAGGNRGNSGRRRRSPSPKVVRDKDHRRGRSRSKERRVERRRSRSHDSFKGRESSRKKSRSPESARDRGSTKVRSPSRDSLKDRRAAVLESFERTKRSRSGDSGPEPRQSREKPDVYDRRRRSKSKEESGRLRPSTRGDSIERRRRSRSRDSQKDKNRDVSRRADSVERRRRSRSRSIRDRRVEDRLVSRHSDGLDRRHRSRSLESLRDRKVDDRDRRRVDDFRHRSGRDDRSSRDGRHHEASRESTYRTDRDRERDRDRNYNSSHDRGRSNNDSQIKESQQSMRESMAAEALREEENQEEYQERVASQLAAQEEDDVDRVKEESRKRRQAILEKYRKQQQKAADERAGVTDQGQRVNGKTDKVNVAVPESIQAEKHVSPTQLPAPAHGTVALGRPPSQNGIVPLAPSAAGGLGEGSPKSERSADMFCDDIFGESPAGGRRLGRGDGLAMDTSGLIDNWDDAEGYYCFRIGEVLDGRYEVASSHGRGVFSTVVRARDMKASRGEPEEVAIKIIRNNETMYKAGQQELVILKKLAGADPENKRHCVRLLSSFEYRSHLCLVFESLHMNLREILKKFGRNIGINLTAVRTYAKQLFISLKHLRNCGVLHCDIKPDNMLVNESKNVLKLCDFGSAMFAGENEITPYLVSRFYRAPEIILGLPYDHALDIWSVGCCLYELYTGKMLFPGHTNNDMLRLHMELKGPFPKKMLKKAAFADQHFDQDFNFCAIEEDPVTKKAIKRIMVNVKPRDMGILVHGSGSVDEDTRMLANFKDLLEKIFTLDPDKRLTVSQALGHSFLSGK